MATKDNPATPVYEFDLSGAEELLNLSEIAAAVQKLRRGRTPHLSSVRNWISVGVRGVKLPALLVGGAKLSSAGAIAWWIRACSAADAGQEIPAPPKRAVQITPGQRVALTRHGVLREAE